jgi:DNA-binding NarL/FixJ family response regulator
VPRRNLRVLLLEDNGADADLIRRQLARTGRRVTVEQVDSGKEFTRALREFAPHVVICDHSLVQFGTGTALRFAQIHRPMAPLIVVTGALDEQMIVASVRAGAEDVILKGNLSRLLPSIDAALAMRQKLAQLSPRQLEVLRLVTEGDTTPTIAKHLKLSAKTVESHRHEIMERLNIHNLVGLVRYAVRVGLVAQEP